MIHPSPSNVLSFLWNHLEKDLKVLGQALDLNMDNAAVTVHLILTGFPTGEINFVTTFSTLLLIIRLLVLVLFLGSDPI